MEVQRAHDMTKLGTFFFQGFLFSAGEVPKMCHSTAVACLQPGLSLEARRLNWQRMEKFWREKFSTVYPNRVDAVGRSCARAVVAERMTDCTLTNATTHDSGGGLKEDDNNAFRSRLDLGKDPLLHISGRLVDCNPAMVSVKYDLKKRPSEYVAATYKRAACLQTGGRLCSHVKRDGMRSYSRLCCPELQMSSKKLSYLTLLPSY